MPEGRTLDLLADPLNPSLAAPSLNGSPGGAPMGFPAIHSNGLPPGPEDAPPSEFLIPSRLSDARRRSWLRMAWVRDMREKVVRAFAGVSTEDQADTPSFCNLMEQAVDTLHPQLVAGVPKATVEPIGSLNLEGPAMIRELSLNRTARDIKLGQLHSDAVLDALLGPMAICRTGLKAGPERYLVGDRQFTMGSFYAALIDLDDYVCDQAGRSDGALMFEGHRYRIPRKTALDSGLYNPDVITSLAPLRLGRYEKGNVEELGGRQGDPYLLIDMVELWDIAVYLGDTTLICTLADSRSSEWAREPYEYWGPATGPYVKLSFSKLPNNAIPKVWGARILDLAEAANDSSAKMVDDILTDKTVHTYVKGEEDAADAVKGAHNNEWVAVENKDSVQTHTEGGVKEQTLAAIQWLKEMFNTASLSPDILGGQKDNSGTATGASILQGNAVVRLKQMQARSQEFLSDIFRHMGWYKDNDPGLEETVVARLDGGEKVELVNNAQMRRGGFADFNYSTDAFASQPTDPVVKLANLLKFLPELPVLMQLGPEAFSKVMHIAAKALEEEMLDEINPDQQFAQLRDMLAQTVQPPGAATGVPQRGQPAGGPTPALTGRMQATRGAMGPGTAAVA